jgi:hypothetical protein
MGTSSEPVAALKYETEVLAEGRVEVAVPLHAGARVTVFVIPESRDNCDDLVAAAGSALGFWDNPYDDEATSS